MKRFNNTLIIELLNSDEIEEIIQIMKPYVKMIALKIMKKLSVHIELEELISNGYIGLIDAIKKFTTKKSSSFKSYAEIRIRGSILDYLRSQDILPRSARDKINRQQATKQKIEAEKNSEATDQEMAKALSFKSLEEYYSYKQKLIAVQVVHFDDVYSYREVSYDPVNKVSDRPHRKFESDSNLSVLSSKLNYLNKKQKKVIELYYFKEMNLKEIGKEMELTESRISQLHVAALKTLRKLFKNDKEIYLQAL